jgi:hypothetical protein
MSDDASANGVRDVVGRNEGQTFELLFDVSLFGFPMVEGIACKRTDGERLE